MGSLAIDPALQVAPRLGLGLLLLWSALEKWRGFDAFRGAVSEYRLVPRPLLPTVTAGVLMTETALGIGLLAVGTGPLAPLAAAALLGIYTAAIAINLRRGRRDIDCGCAGFAGPQPIGRGLVLRNLVLIGLALLCAAPSGPRDLIWLDALTVAFATLTLCALYASIERAIANSAHPANGIHVR